jgi:hypothetical protein
MANLEKTSMELSNLKSYLALYLANTTNKLEGTIFFLIIQELADTEYKIIFTGTQQELEDTKIQIENNGANLSKKVDDLSRKLNGISLTHGIFKSNSIINVLFQLI